MKTLASIAIAALVSTSLAGCFVRTRDRHHHHHHKHRGHSHARERDCPPAYHWNGDRCVHNGRGKAKGHRR